LRPKRLVAARDQPARPDRRGPWPPLISDAEKTCRSIELHLLEEPWAERRAPAQRLGDAMPTTRESGARLPLAGRVDLAQLLQGR
jgi:hypothetical protein